MMKSAYGFVYLARNREMPGLYKIGHTRLAPLERIRQLGSSTSIPAPFHLMAYCQVDNPEAVELAFHQMYAEKRNRASREFFAFKPGELKNVYKALRNEGLTFWGDWLDIRFLCSANTIKEGVSGV